MWTWDLRVRGQRAQKRLRLVPQTRQAAGCNHLTKEVIGDDLHERLLSKKHGKVAVRGMTADGVPEGEAQVFAGEERTAHG